jgi:hypothetical protein
MGDFSRKESLLTEKKRVNSISRNRIESKFSARFPNHNILDTPFGSFSTASGKYKNDQQDGVWSYTGEGRGNTLLYHENGNIWKVDEVEYFSDDEPSYAKISNSRYSKIIHWHDNGQKRDETTYIEGVEHGQYTEWYKNGKVKSEIGYSNGEFDGNFASYYENGQAEVTGTYDAGQPAGIWSYYNEEGDLIDEINYDSQEKRELSVKESREFWRRYQLAVKEPKVISKLLDEIPEENSTIFAPSDFDILAVESDAIEGKKNKYLPKNPKDFLLVIERLKELYFKPLPEKSLL